jgi:hypothetical protein
MSESISNIRNIISNINKGVDNFVKIGNDLSSQISQISVINPTVILFVLDNKFDLNDFDKVWCKTFKKFIDNKFEKTVKFTIKFAYEHSNKCNKFMKRKISKLNKKISNYNIFNTKHTVELIKYHYFDDLCVKLYNKKIMFDYCILSKNTKQTLSVNIYIKSANGAISNSLLNKLLNFSNNRTLNELISSRNNNVITKINDEVLLLNNCNQVFDQNTVEKANIQEIQTTDDVSKGYILLYANEVCSLNKPTIATYIDNDNNKVFVGILKASLMNPKSTLSPELKTQIQEYLVEYDKSKNTYNIVTRIPV